MICAAQEHFLRTQLSITQIKPMKHICVDYAAHVPGACGIL